MKERSDKIRWIVIIIVLVIAAIGLYYYFSYASSGPPAAKLKSASKQGATKKAATKKAEGATKKAAKEKRTESKGSPPKKGKEAASPNNKKTTPKKSTKSDSSASKNPPTPAQGKKKTKSQPTPPNIATKQGDAPDDSIHERVLRRPYKPDDPDRPHLVDLLSGDNLLLEGKYTLAMEKFNEVLKQFPQSTRAMYGKGVALKHMAREKRSNKLLDTAVDFLYQAGMESFMGAEDVRIEALKELADTAYERGKSQLAIRALEKLVEYQKNNADVANQLGMGYLAIGNRKKAKSHFKKVLEQFKGDDFAKAQLGFILFSDKKYEEALPLLLEGIRENEIIKMNPKFYLYAGDTLTRLNRSDEVRIELIRICIPSGSDIFS
jgi:aspartate beta-hydroxylase